MENKENIQSSQTMPGPEQEKLGVFLGRWHTSGDVSDPAVKVDAIDTYEWYAGGFFLLHHADGKVGDEIVKSLEIIGYDQERNRYFAWFFDNTGGFGKEDLHVDGDTWTWRGSNVMGVKEHRCIAVVSGDGRTISARHEKSDDGKNWTLWMNVTLKKADYSPNTF